MNLQHLDSFIAVANAGSVSAAAKERYVSHTALQQQLKILEREVGFSLFDRSPKGVRLTKAGSAFFARAVDICAEASRAVEEGRRIARAEARVIQIGCRPGQDLMFYKYACESAHPDLRVEFTELGMQEDATCALFDKKLDAVTVEYVPDAIQPDVSVIPIEQSYLCCLVAAGSPLAQLPCVHVRDLAGCKLFTCPTDLRVFAQLDALLANEGLAIEYGHSDRNDVLRRCASGDVFVSSRSGAASFGALKAVRIEPELAYIEGMAFLKDARENVCTFLDVVRTVRPVQRPLST